MLRFRECSLWESAGSRQQKRPRCHWNGASVYKHVDDFGVEAGGGGLVDGEALEGGDGDEGHDAEGHAGGDGLDGVGGIEVFYGDSEGLGDGGGRVGAPEGGVGLTHGGEDTGCRQART